MPCRRTRGWGVLVVAAFVLVAGCSGGSPGGTDGDAFTGTPTASPTTAADPTTEPPTTAADAPTETPTATPTATAGPATEPPTATPTATGSATCPPTADPPDRYPPGFDATGYADRPTAFQGHVRSLLDTSFTSTTRARGTPTSETVRIEADPDRRRVAKVYRINGTVAGEFVYENGSVEATGEFASGGNVTYRRAILFSGQFKRISEADLANPRSCRRQGRTVVTYDVTGDGVTGALTVSEDGLITHYTVAEPPRRGNRTVRYDVVGVGNTTVEAPSRALPGGA
jgi:hypothetical protein